MNRALWIAATVSRQRCRTITCRHGQKQRIEVRLPLLIDRSRCSFSLLQARYFGNDPRQPQLSQENSTGKQLLRKPSPWTDDDWKTAEKELFARPSKLTKSAVSFSFQLLDRMVRESQQGKFILTNDHVNQVLDRWRIGTRYRKVVDPKTWSATKVLRRVEEYAYTIPTLTLNTKTYSMIMAVQIKQFPTDSASFCTDVVQRMAQSSSGTAPPNAVALTYLMDAHVQSGQSNATQATQTLFDYLVERGQEDATMAPTEKSLTRVLQAWVSLAPASSNIEATMDIIKDNIRKLLDNPSRYTTKVLPDAVFLDLILEDCSKRGNRTTSTMLADALLMHVMELAAAEHSHLLPEAKTLSRMIFLWRDSDLPNHECAERMEYWLGQMRRLWWDVPGYDSPRYTVYAVTIAAWGGSDAPQAAYHADRIFQNMVDDTGTATIRCYETLIRLWTQQDKPDRAEQILHNMVEASSSDEGLLPPMSAFNDVIEAWQRTDATHKAASHSHELLRRMLDLKELYPDCYENVNDELPLEACIDLWNRSGCEEADVKIRTIFKWMAQHAIPVSYQIIAKAAPSLPAPEATGLLENMAHNQREAKEVQFEAEALEAILLRWSLSVDEFAGIRAQELLERYHSLPKEVRSEYQALRCYRHAVSAWAHTGAPEAPMEMGKILDQMYQQLVSGVVSSNPESHIVMAEAWALSNLPESIERTRHYFSQAVDLSRSKGCQRPESIWYEQVIAALVCNQSNLPQAENLLQRACRDGATPTHGMYAAIIKTFVHAGMSHDLDKATVLLEEMVTLYMGGNDLVKPRFDLFSLLIGERAKRKESQQMKHLWGLLERLQQYDPDEMEFQLDLGSTSINDGSINPGRDASILHFLLGESDSRNVDEDAIKCVMEALASSGDRTSGQRAEGILLKMQVLYEEGALNMEPTFHTFQKVIDCWVNSKEEGTAARANDVLTLAETVSAEGNERLRPDSNGYMSVIKAWASSHDANAPDHIIKLIQTMKERHDQGERDFALTGSAYEALIQAYANSGNPEAAKLAQQVFDATPVKLKDAQLYNALIGAQGGDSISAEAILQEMHRAFLDGNKMVQPNVESFNMVLRAWSKSGSPMAAWRCDGIFNRMNELASTGQLPAKPNGRTFDMVISTLANELGADGALKVERYLELLKDYYRSGEPDCLPSVTSYTEAIRAWGSNLEDPRSVLRAKALLDEMHELAREGLSTVQPDQNTYSVYLRALARSTAETRIELADDVATMMKSDGIRLEGHLLESLQRCLLPRTVVRSGWTVILEDEADGGEEVVRLR